MGTGSFQLSAGATVAVSPHSGDAAAGGRFLADWLHLKLSTSDSGDLLLTNDGADVSLGEEGYDLDVRSDGVTLRARSAAGFFYGAQTLRQLVPEPSAGAARIPALRITDRPRYPWRGLMLDCSRHFLEVAYLKKVIDAMAYLKLNRLHWHLTDNNGWRLQIDAFPKLTEIGAAREYGDTQRPPLFYTRADVREVVAYANARHIMVIPEIEMPSHSEAALVAYPELRCDGSHYPFCAGVEAVFPFLTTILEETIDLFGHQTDLIHLGGDERPKGAWESCPRCQARMRELGLPSADALQTWFMRRINDFVAAKGKRAISWAVTESDPYDPTDMADIGHRAIVQNWHNGTRFAARCGWDVINSRHESVYLDYPQFAAEKASKPDWMHLLPLEQVYAFEPTPEGLTPDQARHVLGSEACLWTEFVPQAKADQSLFPRLLALAEVVWSPREQRDFADFSRRVTMQRKRLGALGLRFAEPVQG